MIVLMNRETCKKCNVPDEYITEMEELQEEDEHRTYPYTRLHIVDPKQNHDYYLNVVDSKRHIQKLIEANKTAEKASE